MLKPLFILMDLFLLALMAYLGVSYFYTATTGNLFAAVSFKPPIETEPHDSEASNSSFSHYRGIIDRNLFNTVTRDHKKAYQIDIDGLDQTGLELRLWGTVTSNDGEAYAVIQHKGEKKQDLYQEGDAIGGGVIKMILQEKVVLRVGSKDEILEMEKRPQVKKMTRQTPYHHPMATAQHATNAGSQQEIVITRNQIDETVKNVHELMTQAQITPHFKGGTIGASGLYISAIKSDSIFGKMGLRDQDIIMGIDGKTIRSLDDALDLYQNLKNSDRMRLQVERRGQVVELNYAIE